MAANAALEMMPIARAIVPYPRIAAATTAAMEPAPSKTITMPRSTPLMIAPFRMTAVTM